MDKIEFETLRTVKEEVTKILKIHEEMTVARDAAFMMIEKDPHSWSTRSCQTCNAITAIIHRPFGCVARAKGLL